MNCKPGDLAVIVCDKDFPNNIGAFLKVVDRADDLDGLPTWGVVAPAGLMCWDHPGRESGTASMTRAGEVVEWNDCDLRPIRPKPEDATDETLLWLPSPSKETA